MGSVCRSDACQVSRMYWQTNMLYVDMGALRIFLALEAHSAPQGKGLTATARQLSETQDQHLKDLNPKGSKPENPKPLGPNPKS